MSLFGKRSETEISGELNNRLTGGINVTPIESNLTKVLKSVQVIGGTLGFFAIVISIWTASETLRYQNSMSEQGERELELHETEVPIRETELSMQITQAAGARSPFDANDALINLGEEEAALEEATPDATRVAEATATGISVRAVASVYEYYNFLSSEQYEVAWGLLTDRFREVSNNNDFANYRAFWKTVDNVVVAGVGIESISQSDAELLVTLIWNQGEFSWEKSYTYYLVFDLDKGIWQINRVIAEEV